MGGRLAIHEYSCIELQLALWSTCRRQWGLPSPADGPESTAQIWRAARMQLRVGDSFASNTLGRRLRAPDILPLARRRSSPAVAAYPNGRHPAYPANTGVDVAVPAAGLD